MSGFISLTLTPVMCALFLTRERGHAKGRFNRAAEAFFDFLVGGYDRGLAWVFRHQFLTLLSTVVLIIATGLLYVIIPEGVFSRTRSRPDLRPSRSPARYLV